MLVLTAQQVSTESYAEYVERSLQQPDMGLERTLEQLGVPALERHSVLDRVEANSIYLDAPFLGSDDIVRPSTDARIAVPLLVQLVREWSGHGRAQRGQAFAPLVAAMSNALGHVTSPRVLVPGSGLGRLTYDLAVALEAARPHLVAVEPDLHAQLIAQSLLEPYEGQEGGYGGVGRVCDNPVEEGGYGAAATEEEESPVPARCQVGQVPLYPSVHVHTGWASTSDRLAAVAVPDVSQARRLAVQEHASVELVVGRFPEAIGAAARPSSDAGFKASTDALTDDARAPEHAAAFDGAVTCFFLDVAPDILGVARALHRLLLPRNGTWANLGPLAYPDAPFEAMGGANPAFALTVSQLLALVRTAGFHVREERLVPCEYGGLPRRLERTERTCLFFVAGPVARSAV